jgi:hypothetical protein
MKNNKELDYLSQRLSSGRINTNWRDRAALKSVGQHISNLEKLANYNNAHLIRFVTWTFVQLYMLKTKDGELSKEMFKSINWKIEEILNSDPSTWSKSMAVDLYCSNFKGPTIKEHQSIIEDSVEEVLLLNRTPNDS